MNGLDICTGLGGISLALQPWIKPVAYCEIDPHAQRLLLRRMECGEIERAPIWDDLTTLTRKHIPEEVSIGAIYGGTPCQGFSNAGHGLGMDDSRSSLISHVFRLAREFEPTFIFLENVPAIRTKGLNYVLSELASLGFDARWTSVSADFIGAPHRRERWFLLAYSHRNGSRLSDHAKKQKESLLIDGIGEEKFVAHAESIGPQGLETNREQVIHSHGGEGLSLRGGEEVANADLHGLGKQPKRGKKKDFARYGEDYWRSTAGPFGSDWFRAQPRVGRGPDGLPETLDGCGGVGDSLYSWEEGINRTCQAGPKRAERIKQLGNAVVPAQVRTAFQYLMGF